MDEGVGDEVTAIDAVNGIHLQGKEGEYSLKADSASVLESHEMIIPGEGEGRDSSPHMFATTLEGKNFDGSSMVHLEHPYVSQMDDTGVMVEELTLRNYDSGNLAIVGTSNNRDRMQTKRNQWQHLYQIAGGSASGSSRREGACKDKGRAKSTVWEDVGYTNFPEFLGQKSPDDDHNKVMENLQNNENKAVSSNTLLSPGGIRTKILSKSGFSEYFIKNTLKGKGVICRGPAREGSGVEFRDLSVSKGAGSTMIASDAPSSASAQTVVHPSYGVTGPGPGLCFDAFHNGVNLREWLKAGRLKVNKVESLYIFRQIVDLVDFSHSQGVALQDLSPSYFKLLPSNQVVYLGSSPQKEMAEKDWDQDIPHLENDRNEKRPSEHAIYPAVSQWTKKQKIGENTNFIRWRPQFPSRPGFKFADANDTDVNIVGPQDSMNELNKEHTLKMVYKTQSNSSGPRMSTASQLLSTFVSDPMEEKWMVSLVFGQLSFLTTVWGNDIGNIDSMEVTNVENPREAGFCLWLLHPEPSSRPTAREILQSDIVSGIQKSCGDELSSSIDEDDTESELLLRFLVSLKEQKQKDALKLVEEVNCLEADIEEVERRQTKKSLVLSCSSMSLGAGGNRFLHREYTSSDVHSNLFPISNNELSLMRNRSQLESAYFSMRSNIQLSDSDVTERTNKELLKYRENWSLAQKDEEKHKPTDHLGAFFSGLCKYARYRKFEVRGILRNESFNNSANVICSLSFDRDEDYFAAAGVSKKIKIFDFHALFDDTVDIHYPVIEMPNKSRLSCICWNNYIRNYLASTDYDGVVKKNSLCTIGNIANVCSVQFSAQSTHLLSFGSADYKTYCYDLRNVSHPWCVLAGHDKAVSQVKFLDSETLVSASTDNTLKIWDLNKTSSSGFSTTACILTLRGHTNEKNFVGLSVADGYIACGSETNEVYAYYRSLPMPITSHKFGSINPISGKETDDDNGQTVICTAKELLEFKETSASNYSCEVEGLESLDVSWCSLLALNIGSDGKPAVTVKLIPDRFNGKLALSVNVTPDIRSS
ncbi:hypothetical protein F0562_011596 [Nyssa sinensis]|uniref:Uncharacterized protein n=1 Tax=Nyssa sinensis TaxID=561372 RepID=A0A5J4ZPW2_9ASTE|nr:hypothetical protein F0562_011596 [Nyssa sinensis]